MSDENDTATAYHYNLGGNGAYHISIRPSATVSITHINGVTLSYPLTVSTAGYVDTHVEWRSIIVQTSAANTSLKVYAKGGK